MKQGPFECIKREPERLVADWLAHFSAYSRQPAIQIGVSQFDKIAIEKCIVFEFAHFCLF
jgi:hypothetical protein